MFDCNVICKYLAKSSETIKEGSKYFNYKDITINTFIVVSYNGGNECSFLIYTHTYKHAWHACIHAYFILPTRAFQNKE